MAITILLNRIFVAKLLKELVTSKEVLIENLLKITCSRLPLLELVSKRGNTGLLYKIRCNLHLKA